MFSPFFRVLELAGASRYRPVSPASLDSLERDGLVQRRPGQPERKTIELRVESLAEFHTENSGHQVEVSATLTQTPVESANH